MKNVKLTFTVPATIKILRFKSDGSETTSVVAKVNGDDNDRHIVRVDPGTLCIAAKNAGAGSRITIPAVVHGEKKVPDSQFTRLTAELNWPEAEIAMAPTWARGEARVIIREIDKKPADGGDASTDAQDAAEAANA